MNVNALSRRRPGYDEGGQEIGGVQTARSPGTLISALNTVAEARNRLIEVADEAERIASTVAGSTPGVGGIPSEKSGVSGSLAEDLNERAEALQAPILRIQGALARINRSVGV